MYNYDISLKQQVFQNNLKALPFQREKIDYKEVRRNKDIVNLKVGKWSKKGDGSLHGKELRRQINREDNGIIMQIMMKQAKYLQNQEIKRKKKEEEERQKNDIMEIIKKDREAQAIREKLEAAKKKLEKRANSVH